MEDSGDNKTNGATMTTKTKKQQMNEYFDKCIVVCEGQVGMFREIRTYETVKSFLNSLFSEEAGYSEEFVEKLDKHIELFMDFTNLSDSKSARNLQIAKALKLVKIEYLETHSEPEVDIEKVIEGVLYENMQPSDEAIELRALPSDVAKQIADALRKAGVM